MCVAGPLRRALLRPRSLLAAVTVGLALVSFATACGSGRPSLTSSGLRAGAGSAPPRFSHAIWGAPLTGGSPRALVILLHGGGWAGFNRPALKLVVSTAAVAYRRQGYETLAVDYPAGVRGVDAVERIYREARQRVGHIPICAMGVSAGGHIALMLAVKFPDIRCVIAEAAPTDLPALAREPGGATAYRIAARAFGPSNLARLSPALHAASIRARLLLVDAADDPLVPIAQGELMKHADPSAKLIVLPPGPAPFVHTGVGGPVSSTGVSLAAKQLALLTEVHFLHSST